MGAFWSLCLSVEDQEMARLKTQPRAVLDTDYTGSDCVVVKNGLRLCGSGGALANAPLVQNKSYFEFQLQAAGQWGIGVATRAEDLEKVPLGTTRQGWVLRSSGDIYHNNELQSQTEIDVQEGDVVGCSYDHVELQFYHNGTCLNCPLRTVRGEVYPVYYVDDGAIIDVAFKDFSYSPPEGFSQIMFEQSLL